MTSTSVVRYRGKGYSVPVAFGLHDVWTTGVVDRVVVGCATEGIAWHVRSFGTGGRMFDPVHYPSLIERKIMAFDQVARCRIGIYPMPLHR